MSVAVEFTYRKPRTISEAIRLLSSRSSATRILAGGTDLVGWLRDGLVAPEQVVDIKALPGLDRIELRGGQLHIGALVTFSAIQESTVVQRRFPLLAEMAAMLACRGIRNRATMVGNICSAVPCCDSGPALLVYDARIRVAGPRGRRVIRMADWFVGPRRTALKTGELVVGIDIPLPRGKAAGAFVKLKRYRGEDLAQASVAILLDQGRHVRVAFGAVAPVPVRARQIEALLAGTEWTPERLKQAVALLPQETAPIADIRASREYRAHMLGVMLERGLRVTEQRWAGAGPAYGVNAIETGEPS